MKFTTLIRLLLVSALALTAVGAGFAQMGEVADPVPYPEGVQIGENPIVTFSLDEMLVYKALDSYSEPAWVTALVEAGELPPVEERLPENPQVILESGMSTGPGVYGGVWRDFSAVPTAGWNLCARQTQGWFGINYIYGESLVKSGPMFLRHDNLEPLPNLATDWAWSEDGSQLVMNIIRGAKWSDGHAFGVHDIMFTWEHIILDENVNSWTNRSTWQINGEDIMLEQTGDDQVTWTFPEAYPVQLLFKMDFLDFNICAEHIYSPMHPAVNEESDYDTFETFQVQDDLPVPTMGPWVAVDYQIDEFMVHRRNPYYWKVDEQGHQLPYIEEVTFEKGPSGIGRTLGTLAGSIDHTNLENPSTYVEAITRSQEDDAHFYIEWGPETLAFDIEFNLSSSLGVQDERDQALRDLFRDQRFRRAVQHAVDGDGVGQAVIRGPFMRAFASGLTPGSPYFDINSVVYYPYSPDSASALLAEIGFEDSDGDGILNWTDGPLAGDNLVVVLDTSVAAEATGQIGDAFVLLMQEVGVQVNLRPLQGPASNDAITTGTWEMRVDRIGQEYTTSFTRCQDLGPVTDITPDFHRADGGSRDLLDFEEELIEVVNAFCLEPDFDARKELMFRYNQLFTENVYKVGGVVGRYGLALAKRFNNIPVGAPPFFYQWTWGNVIPEAVWVNPDEQIAEIFPGTLPDYGMDDM
ncbi:MAG: ABC transporter substrate-binding protein [Chloroflexi bacterium]|nr:ABC transporter substrate-binding protein [Chloroflexota bacterium]